jgi:hypothetical protein
MKHRCTVFVLVIFFYGFFPCSRGFSQEDRSVSSPPVSKRLTLVDAVMCEEVKDLAPKNQAIVFSLTLGKVSCFNSFDPVPEESFVYHSWFFRDKLSTRIKLSLKPPRWSTFSSIQLREADQGPWRVEIADRDGHLLHVLRFSITD